MNKKAINIGHIDMEFVRRALSKNVMVKSNKVYCLIPGQGMSINIGRCTKMGSYYNLDINLVVKEEELIGLKGTVLDSNLLINSENVLVDGAHYYLRIDSLLIYIGCVIGTTMKLEIPFACTKRSFDAQKRRDQNHK